MTARAGLGRVILLSTRVHHTRTDIVVVAMEPEQEEIEEQEEVVRCCFQSGQAG